MKYPESIQKLIDIFTNLPSVGQKTAERFVFYLLRLDQGKLNDLSDAVLRLKSDLKVCQTCFSISDKNPCAICSDPNRNKSQLLIVAGYRDLVTLENTGEFKGHYHILGGVINMSKDIKPENLTIKKLFEKIKNGNISEVIIALNPDIEGETTSLYLTKSIKELNLKNIKITRIARGLPIGSDLEYADELTLSNALRYRNEL